MAIAIGALGSDIETRNSEYKPQIEIETIQEEQTIWFEWNINEERNDVDFDTVSLKLTNVGNGNADNVTVEFDSEVLEEWIKK